MDYFYGADTYAAREAIGEVAKTKQAQVRWLDRESLEEKHLMDWVDEGAGNLFGREVVVVRDASKMPKPLQEAIAEAAGQGKDMIVWDRVQPDKRSKLWRALKKQSQEFRQLSEQELAAWVGTQGPVDAAAARMMVQRIGPDRWRLKTTLEVLLLTREKVEVGDIEEFVEANREAEIFAMLDALAAGNVKAAVLMMEQMLAAGESEFYILSMLAYQCKTLLAVRSGDTQGLHPYVVQKNTAAGQRFSEEQLLGALVRVAATDFAIKQGMIDARTGLVMLMVRLFS